MTKCLRLDLSVNYTIVVWWYNCQICQAKNLKWPNEWKDNPTTLIFVNILSKKTAGLFLHKFLNTTPPLLIASRIKLWMVSIEAKKIWPLCLSCSQYSSMGVKPKCVVPPPVMIFGISHVKVKLTDLRKTVILKILHSCHNF